MAQNHGDNYAAHSRIVTQVQNGDKTGMADLYEICRFHRYSLFKSLGQDSEDTLHDVYVAVVTAIREGRMRDPERLIGFVHTVTRRKIADKIKSNIYRRSHELGDDFTAYADWLVEHPGKSPESQAIASERGEIADIAFESLSDTDRHILREFYLADRAWPEIAAEMDFNASQFRCHKSRAKAKFGAAGRRVLDTGTRLKEAA